MSFAKRKNVPLRPLDIEPLAADLQRRLMNFEINPSSHHPLIVARSPVASRSLIVGSNSSTPEPRAITASNPTNSLRRSSNPNVVCSPLLSISAVWRFDSGATTSHSVPEAGSLPCSKSSVFPNESSSDLDFIEHLARTRRTSIGGVNVPGSGPFTLATVTWKGTLSPKSFYATTAISRKVFVGGLCRDVNTMCLNNAFAAYGLDRVEWCERHVKGFAYVIFKSERMVRTLLQDCTRDLQGRYYFKIGTVRPFRDRKVQLIPWIVEDADFTAADCVPMTNSCCSNARDFHSTPAGQHHEAPTSTENTVFVGALHGEMTAFDLAIVMEQLFGKVLAVGLDTDKCRYPVGTARVTFRSTESYAHAIAAEYIGVDSNKFRKTLQVDPYLQDVICSRCRQRPGPVFCRYYECFTYFCASCFMVHAGCSPGASSTLSGSGSLGGSASSFAGKNVIPDGHVPLMRNRVRKTVDI